MPNSNTKHSKALRVSTSIEWLKQKRLAKQIVTFNVNLTDDFYINKAKSLQISKKIFVEKALELLDENGEVKVQK